MRFCGRHALLLLVCLLLSDLAHLGVQAEAQQTTVCPSRARKAWGAMTSAEQTLYVEALGLGMQRGYHILFTELASEATSSAEFFRTCGFLYWNRRFVLAYENMLRGLDSKFACLTIPYWDYFADYARLLEGKCEDGGTSLEACSSILRGLGGSQGATRSVTINGKTVSGNCVTKAPANSFCESSTITSSSQCAHCIPRANWATKTFPAGFGYAGIGVVLGEANGFREVTQGIQLGTHNAMHNALSSTMATYVSPADPVFYSLHATVDLLHQIYLECHLGDDAAPTAQNVSRWAFQQCRYRDEVMPTATSNVTQLWMVAELYPVSKGAIRAEIHPKLSRFFKPLRAKYWQLVNIRKLGTMSYEYQRDDLLQNLQRYGFVCPTRGAPIRTALSSTPTTNLEARTISTPSTDTELTDLEARTVSVPTIDLEATTNVDAATDSETTTALEAEAVPSARNLQWGQPQPAELGVTYEREQQERELVQLQTIELLQTTLVDALGVDGTTKTAFNQAELIECQYHLESMGRVEDYTPFFRANYGLGPDDHPRCWNLVHQMKTGESEILVDNWRGIVADHYNETSGAS